MGIVISLLFVSAAFAQNDAAWRASVSEDLRGINESLRRLNDRLDVLENNHATLQRECARLSDELRSLKANPTTSPQDIERLGAEVKRLDDALKQSNATREREKTALVEQVAKMIDELQRKMAGGAGVSSAIQNRASGGTAAPPASSESVIKHTVKSGENLTVIARSYGVTVADIRAANRLTSDVVRVGQVLTIQRRE
jgi:LysM repeat protein